MKLKFKSDILEFIFLIIFVINFSIYSFFKYIKISKTLSAKYYQENKERLQ